jgi:hypothetical protein
MSTYQYRVVPAPTKGLKAKGVKGPEARFSNTIEDLMNEMGAQGWEYQRAETLPSVERSGLTGSTTEWRNVLVFRKPRDIANAEISPQPSIAPFVPIDNTADDTPEAVENEAPNAAENPHPAVGEGATQMLSDNGVEETSEVAGMTDSLKALANRRSTDNSER